MCDKLYKFYRNKKRLTTSDHLPTANFPTFCNAKQITLQTMKY